MLGAVPQDEDFPPDDPNEVDPNNFEFFGFGQTVKAHHPQMAPMALLTVLG